MNRQYFNYKDEFAFRAESLKPFYQRLSGWIDFKDKDVLSIGSSEGGELKALSEMGAKSLAGIDIDEDRVRFSKTQFSEEMVRIEACMAEKLPFEDDSFDLISCLEVIEHVVDPGQVLSEMHRVLRTDAVAIITFPSYDAISGPHLNHLVKLPWLQHIIGLEKLREKAKKKYFKQSGKEIEEWDPLNGITIKKFKHMLGNRFEIIHEQILSPYWVCKIFLKLGLFKDLCGDRCRFVLVKL